MMLGGGYVVDRETELPCVPVDTVFSMGVLVELPGKVEIPVLSTPSLTVVHIGKAQ